MSVMNTGICKKTALGLTALMVLSACSEGSVFGLLKETKTAPAAQPVFPLLKAQMVESGVTLVPPAGYCIDATSLTQSFALMARCDLMGTADAGLDAPIGLITASIAKNRGKTLNAADVAQASNANVIETLDTDGLNIVRAETDTPPMGLAKTHYRATTQIGGFDLSLALFSPIESAAQGIQGALMLQNLVRASRGMTIKTDVATTVTTDTAKPKLGFRTTTAQLFE